MARGGGGAEANRDLPDRGPGPFLSHRGVPELPHPMGERTLQALGTSRVRP